MNIQGAAENPDGFWGPVILAIVWGGVMTDEAHFYLLGYVKNKIIATGHLKIHKSSVSLSTAKD
jgi:hypothetical protein